jgi:hypothetical protein
MGSCDASVTHGFVITNASGERLAAAERFEDALALMRGLPSASEVVRASDGAVLAWKPRPVLTTRVRGAA